MNKRDIRRMVQWTSFRSNRGDALLSVVIVMFILTIIGTAIISVTFSNTVHAAYMKNYEASYYDSEAVLRLGCDSVKKAAAIELAKLKKNGDEILPDDYLVKVKATALTLIPREALYDAGGNERLTITVPSVVTKTSQVILEAKGETAGLERTTEMAMDFIGVSGPIPFDYDMIIGGNLDIYQAGSKAKVKIVLSTEGALAGELFSNNGNKYSISGTLNRELPDTIAWWDDLKSGLIERFSTVAEGMLKITGDVVEINATGPTYPQNNVMIKKVGSSIQVGSRLFNTLQNKAIIVNGNIILDSSMTYNTGITENLMLFATGNISLDTGTNSINVTDPLFIYASGSFTFNEHKGGGGHNLFIYAGSFTYYNNDTGSTKPEINGQIMVEGNMNISVTNANITFNISYNKVFISNFYNRLSVMADEGIVNEIPSGTGTGISLPKGTLFIDGKIIEK